MAHDFSKTDSCPTNSSSAGLTCAEPFSDENLLEPSLATSLEPASSCQALGCAPLPPQTATIPLGAPPAAPGVAIAVQPNHLPIISCPTSGGPSANELPGVVFHQNQPFVLIAGPCSLESRDLALGVADHLAQICAELSIPFVFKASFDKANRTSLGQRGMGWSQAQEIFLEIKERWNCPILTDVHQPNQCESVARVADILQIPAFLCRQTDLIEAAAATGKTLHIKKGQFLSPYEMLAVAKKAVSCGTKAILLCERGSSFGYHNLVVDMRGLAVMATSGFPIILDATHAVQRPGLYGDKSGGERDFVEILARAGIGAGVAGLFMETHPDPSVAHSDGPNMVPLGHMRGLLKTLVALDRASKSLPYAPFSAPTLARP
jgi:2-dehydro-3-deoxyphosphooctonate aldolase (KDO 8-P synthase)